MFKQHQLLSLIDEKKGQFNTLRLESLNVFNKSTNFAEGTRIYTAFKSEDKDHPGDDEAIMVTTVENRLKYDNKHLKSYLNIIGQKEITNTLAKADIVIIDEDTKEKTIIAEQVPITLLLEYEKISKQQIEFFKKSPTLDMKVKWIAGLNTNGDECYIGPETKKTRSRTISKQTSFNPNPPNGTPDKYPLTPQIIKEEITVGEYVSNIKDGRITPSKKANLIKKAEALHSAIKIARATANEQEVQQCNHGTSIVNFLNS